MNDPSPLSHKVYAIGELSMKVLSVLVTVAFAIIKSEEAEDPDIQAEFEM